MAGAVILALGAAWLRSLGAPPTGALVRLLAGALTLSIAVFALPAQSVAMSWRQTNVIAENLTWLARTHLATESRHVAHELNPASKRRFKRALTPELERAKPRHALGHADANVLLILVEGMSGAYLERVRQRAGLGPLRGLGHLDMPRLNRRSHEALFFPNFIANQRQTSRGEYAILCGDYPSLVTHPARMTSGTALPHVCLPQIMRELGYASVYLQAARLTYSSKDAFMPMAGFERVHGVQWFGNQARRNLWGVDDRTFFDGAKSLINELNADTRPWFLTLLTVGTHHPYWRPIGDTKAFAPTDLGTALEFADIALAEFLDALEASGVMRNTLVLVTSDEAAGLMDDSLGLHARVGQNWGTLAAFTPQGVRGAVDAAHMQADIPISILDYLGHGDRWRVGVGRSIFRDYEEPRIMAFGNTYSRTLGTVG